MSAMDNPDINDLLSVILVSIMFFKWARMRIAARKRSAERPERPRYRRSACVLDERDRFTPEEVTEKATENMEW